MKERSINIKISKHLRIWTIALVLSCSQGSPNIFLYLLEVKGNGYFTSVTSKNGSSQGKESESILLSKSKILSNEGYLECKNFSYLNLQLGEFLTIHIEENSKLYYQVSEAQFQDPWLYDIRFIILFGTIGISRSSNGLGRNVQVIINHTFLVSEDVEFQLTKITEKKSQQKGKDEYITVLVRKGALHYISPITGKIDMYIKDKRRFILKNSYPLEFSRLKEQDIKLLKNASIHKPVSFSAVESILLQEKSFLDTLKSRNYLLYTLIALISGLLLAIIGLLKFYKLRRHSFSTMIKYWDTHSTYKFTKKIYFCHPKPKNKIYIGKKGFCHIRLPNWPWKQRLIIKAHLSGDIEMYTIRNWEKKAVFLKRKDSNFLNWGDQFQIDENIFEIQKSDKPAIKTKRFRRK